MSKIDQIEDGLKASPRTWLVTGVAGFIGSHLLDRLLHLGQHVVGLDNFATGYQRNIDLVIARNSSAASQFRFIEGDIRDLATCQEAVRGVDFVFHEAALGSVPRSLKDPLTSHLTNIDGTVHMLLASRDAGVPRIVLACSSSTYGDHPVLPKVEDNIGKPLSPYAVTKLVDELYARIFADCYGLEFVGLRYFNVFGPRQDPNGAYAAVIPRWIAALAKGERCLINGDGETSRDFCYVDNVVQANLLAALAPAGSEAVNNIYNVAVGDRTTLNELHQLIREQVARIVPLAAGLDPEYQPFRAGDVRHSQADISKARTLLGYEPRWNVRQGLEAAVPTYLSPNGRA